MLNPWKKASGAFLLFVLAGYPIYAQQTSNDTTEMYNGQETAANEVLVKFRPTTLTSLIQAEVAEDVDRAEGVGSIGVVRFHSVTKKVATTSCPLSGLGVMHTSAAPPWSRLTFLAPLS